MAAKPIRVFWSPLSNRFYATAYYQIGEAGFVSVTGRKYDVTQDIAAAIVENEIEFTPIPGAPEEGAGE